MNGDVSILPLEQDVFTIGRQGRNHLKISDTHVSRLHAEIVKRGTQYWIQDHNSKTGTYVNGERVQSRQLFHGDRIMLGSNIKPQIVIVFLTEEYDSNSSLSSYITTASQGKDPSSDLHAVSRFLEGVRRFSATLPLQDILDTVLDLALEISAADRAFLVLLDEDNQPAFRSGRNRLKQNLNEDQFQISTNILQKVLTTGERVLLNQESDADLLAQYQSVAELELRTIVCLPLPGFKMNTLENRADRLMIGALYLDSKTSTPGLSTISEGLLESLAGDAGAALMNMKLLQEAREKELLERELETAREIQQNLLPVIRSSYGFFEACAENLPSLRISGDYYDLIPLPGDRFAIVIADVSGKGIPAAILAALVQGALFVELSRDDAPECIQNLNRFLVRRSSSNRFVSLFLGIVSPNGEMSYVNAGHNAPLLLRAGNIHELTTRGVVLGVLENAKYEEQSILLQPGDIVCFYTDGVTEARNSEGKFFGEARLFECLRSNADGTPNQVLDAVLQTVLHYTEDEPRSDDLTLLILKWM